MNDFKFGNFLYELRTEKGLSQSELGDIMGVSNKAVSKWEMGISKPRPAMLLVLSSFFGVTVEELLAGGRNEKSGNEAVEKDDTAMEIWTGEYRKKKRNGRNALITAILIPILMCLCIGLIVDEIPNGEVAGSIIVVVTMFAEAIDIALIFVFYSSARRLKRTLYATYPERAEEITLIISPEKKKKEKVVIPMLKWERTCFIIGGAIACVMNSIALILKLLDVIDTVSDIYIIYITVAVIAFIPVLVALFHYHFITRRKK